MKKLMLGFFLLALLTSCKVENQKETILIDVSGNSTEAKQEKQQEFNQTLKTIKNAGWLKVDPKNLNDWEFKAAEDLDDSTDRPIAIHSKKQTAKRANIVAIFSKKSSAYDTALNSILTLFAGQGLSADLLVLNGENESEEIAEAYAYAESIKPDLILSFGSKATAWIHDNSEAGTIPVVSVTSKDPVLMGQLPDYASGSRSHIAYTSLNIPIDLQLSYLKQFRPELSTIGILYAENNSSAVVTQVDPLILAAEKEGIEIIRFNVQDQQNAKAELENMMPDLINQMQAKDTENNQSLLWITGSTSVFNEIETINQFAAGVPVLSVVTDVTVAGEDSAMLSIGVSFESNALMAAIYAIRILNGESAGNLPVGVATPPDIAINFAIAQQSGIKIPFSFFESANFIYDTKGQPVRAYGQ
ncbi:MAG: ABC transporter substrate-binding protein [Anaerolineae bacterium]